MDDEMPAELHPRSTHMHQMRLATFGADWPYPSGSLAPSEKLIQMLGASASGTAAVGQMAAAGMHRLQEADSDDTALCAYCGLSLNGWEATDKPIFEHRRRSAECPFFVMQDPAAASGSAQAQAQAGEQTQSQAPAAHTAGRAEQVLALAEQQLDRPLGDFLSGLRALATEWARDEQAARLAAFDAAAARLLAGGP
ncbi:hypothetical protein HK105_207167 [Polyrhizophydium stewartii]|uniref:Uncharacterized protein n=1 Tax=Polyrhizophydium stewartii TaxID=2732419 RepID=A0ABR4N1A8_9FUNG